MQFETCCADQLGRQHGRCRHLNKDHLRARMGQHVELASTGGMVRQPHVVPAETRSEQQFQLSPFVAYPLAPLVTAFFRIGSGPISIWLAGWGRRCSRTSIQQRE